MIPRDLVKILACPVCKSDLEYKASFLICKKCNITYPIENGIPILLPPKLKEFLKER